MDAAPAALHRRPPAAAASGTLPPVSPQPRSPKGTRVPARSVKVPDDRWNAAKAKAEKRGETITDVINRKLDEYLEEPDDA